MGGAAKIAGLGCASTGPVERGRHGYSAAVDDAGLDRRGFLRFGAGALGAIIVARQLGASNALAQSPSSGQVATAEAAALRVLAKAREAVVYGSRGVGGLIMENRTGRVIAEGRNRRYRPVALPLRTVPDEVLTWDYTAHGETGLMKWYFANRRQRGLPDPADLTVVTTLDPCAMCTGSILAAGFSVATVALDPTGGMNTDGTGAYPTLPPRLRREAKGASGLYAIEAQRAYLGPPDLPLCKTEVTGATADACSSVFFGAPSRSLNPFDDVPVGDLVDPRSLGAGSAFRERAQRAWPQAFSLRLADPRRPTAALQRLLEDLNRATPGSTNAVAFIDPFGNLLSASADRPERGPIATAFMNTTQAYARTRYALFNDAATHEDAKRTLTAPRAGVFVWLHAPTPGLATTIKDLGAYGSSVGRPSPGSFQYFLPPRQGTIGDLLDQIAALPPFYTQTVAIDPVQVGSAAASRAVRMPRSTEPVPYPAYP